MPEGEEEADFDRGEGHPNHHVRSEEIGAPQGGGEEALQEPLDAHVHEVEAHPPHPAAHQVHPDHPGDQEVDVAAPGLGDRHLAALQRILPPRRPLQRLVHAGAGQDRFRAGRVEPVLHGRARVGPAGHHHHVHAAQPQGLGRLGLAQGADLEEAPAPEARRDRGRPGALQHRHRGGLRGPVAEGKAESHRQEDGKDEAPEDDLGLPVELAEAGEAQGAESAEPGAVTHRGGASRSATRTRPPGWRGGWPGR